MIGKKLNLKKSAAICLLAVSLTACSTGGKAPTVWSNAAASTPEARVQMYNSIVPGQMTFQQVVAQFGRPVGYNDSAGYRSLGVGATSRYSEANFGSGDARNGYLVVRFDAQSDLVLGTWIYGPYDPNTKSWPVERSKEI